MFLGRNVPQLLDAKSENLRSAFLAQVEDLGQPLGQMSPRALGEEGVAGVELDPRLVVGPVAAVAGDAHVAGRDALHRSVLVEQDLGRREAGENLDPELLRLPREPAAEIAEAQRVRALVAHERRHEHMGHPPLAASRSAASGGSRSPARSAARPCSFQSGISSLSAIGSITAPDRMCAPTSLPFSRTQTESSRPASLASCFRRMAAERPGRARRRRSPRHIAWIRARSSVLSSRRKHNSTRLPCQFLDRCVNGARGRACGRGSGIDRRCRGEERARAGGSRPAWISPSRRSRAIG